MQFYCPSLNNKPSSILPQPFPLISQADTIEDFCSPVCRLANSDATIGHFYFLNETALVFNKETNIALGDFIEFAGLIHPLEVEGVGELGLLNIDEVCNPVNKKASETVDGAWQETIALNKLVLDYSI